MVYIFKIKYYQMPFQNYNFNIYLLFKFNFFNLRLFNYLKILIIINIF